MAEIDLPTPGRAQAMGRGRGGVNPPQDWGLGDWLIPLHALRPEASADFEHIGKFNAISFFISCDCVVNFALTFLIDFTIISLFRVHVFSYSRL